MKKSTLIGSTLLLLACFTSPAFASNIVINPNDYSFGTDLSEMFDGLSMAHLKNRTTSTGFDPVASGVYATTSYHVDSGLSIGGRATLEYYQSCKNGSTSPSACPSYSALELRFDNPTDFLEIDSAWFSDAPAVFAYDIFGNQLLFAYGNQAVIDVNGTRTSTITLNRDQKDIARVVYGGMLGMTTPTEITYHVPEPTTLGFMAVGLVGLLAQRKRKR